MGKHKQRRFKSHFPAPQPENSKKDSPLELTSKDPSFTSLPIYFKENVFEGVMMQGLEKDHPKNDDNISMKSHISNKSMKGEKAISKKEKLKMRREMFLKKMDTVNQFKKNNKKKTFPVNGEVKPSFDDLPSLDSLFKLTNKSKLDKTKKKAIEKSKKLQKNIIQNISIYKKLLKNSSLEKNPFEAISNHLKAVIQEEGKILNLK